jgi:hypothetical protein
LTGQPLFPANETLLFRHEWRRSPGGDLVGAIDSDIFDHTPYLRALSAVIRHVDRDANMQKWRENYSTHFILHSRAAEKFSFASFG